MHVICEYSNSGKSSCTFTSTLSNPYFFIQFSMRVCLRPTESNWLIKFLFLDYSGPCLWHLGLKTKRGSQSKQFVWSTLWKLFRIIVPFLHGWIHKRQIIERGYLLDEDFPSWVTQAQRATMSSHYQLWAAHEKKVKVIDKLLEETIEYSPLCPVHVFKHAFQFLYNKGKGGLDKSTEIR